MPEFGISSSRVSFLVGLDGSGALWTLARRARRIHCAWRAVRGLYEVRVLSVDNRAIVSWQSVRPQDVLEMAGRWRAALRASGWTDASDAVTLRPKPDRRQRVPGLPSPADAGGVDVRAAEAHAQR